MTDDDKIRHVLSTYLDAWHRNDAEALAPLFTTDCDFITHLAVWWKGRDEIVNQQRSMASWITRQAPQFRSVLSDMSYLSPDVVIVHGQWEWRDFVYPELGKPVDRAGHLTLILVRQSDGRWLIRSLQNTHRIE